jgi:hypothetical protein
MIPSENSLLSLKIPIYVSELKHETFRSIYLNPFYIPCLI